MSSNLCTCYTYDVCWLMMRNGSMIGAHTNVDCKLQRNMVSIQLKSLRTASCEWAAYNQKSKAMCWYPYGRER